MTQQKNIGLVVFRNVHAEMLDKTTLSSSSLLPERTRAGNRLLFPSVFLLELLLSHFIYVLFIFLGFIMRVVASKCLILSSVCTKDALFSEREVPSTTATFIFIYIQLSYRNKTWSLLG